MKVIGITGGVGAGKSAVLTYIREHYNVYDDALHTSIAGKSLGGLEAVIWSDFVQGIVLMGGAMSVLVLLIMKTGAPGEHFSTFWNVASSYNKNRLFCGSGRWGCEITFFWKPHFLKIRTMTDFVMRSGISRLPRNAAAGG